jgi:two-component system sensor histidine kinase BaeS
MRGRLHWSLRTRLIVAFVGLALLAADLATVYSNLNLDAHVKAAAEARLQRSSTHFGEVAAVVHADNGGWTPTAKETLRHLAMIDDLAVRLVDQSGTVVFELPAQATVEKGASVSAPVRSRSQTLGRITVSQLNGKLLTEEEVILGHRLNRMHLIAGLVSAAIGLAIALYLAFTLSRPLREIRAGAEAMGAGELETRVRETGDQEVRSVAHALNALASTLQHEEEIRKANVADLAHELRTPLMGLLGRIEAAQDGVFTDDAANLAAMHDEAIRLSRLLDDLSTLADAERPGMLLTLEQVDLADVAAGQVLAAASEFAEKGIELIGDLAPAVVAGDRGRLDQVAANLLSNALRYTDAGGQVTVTVRRDGGDAVLEVADTGIGIAAEDVPRVFTRFWRGERSRSRATGGAGIGLSIVKELVTAHGGRVEVRSILGEGSTFTVTIPAAARPPSR